LENRTRAAARGSWATAGATEAAAVVILTVYIDESGTHSGAPLMVLAGCVGTLGKWAIFDRKWAQLLRRNSLTYHHTKELMDTIGEYKNWTVRQKQKFITKAGKLGTEHTLCGFTVALKHTDYDEHYVAGHRPKKIPLDSKYGVCFRIFLSFLPMMMKKSLDASDLNITVMMEAGAQGQGDTSRIFNLLKKQATPEQSQLIGSIKTAGKKDFYGFEVDNPGDYATFNSYQPSDGTMAAMDYFNQQPVVHAWAYKLEKAASETLI
jgi:hypothetical protein